MDWTEPFDKWFRLFVSLILIGAGIYWDTYLLLKIAYVISGLLILPMAIIQLKRYYFGWSCW